MGYIFENLFIQNFKGFRQSVSINITDLNILTGKNNAGKSSLIELINVLYLSLSSDGLNTLKFSELENFSSFDKALNYYTDSDEIVLNFDYNLKYFGPEKTFHVKFVFVKSINNPLDGFLKSVEYYFIKLETPRELVFSLNHSESIRKYPSSEKKLRPEPMDSVYYCNMPLIMNLVDSMIENAKTEKDKIKQMARKFTFDDMIKDVPTIKEFTTSIYSNEYNKIEFKKSTGYIEYFDYKGFLKDFDSSSIGTIYNYNDLDNHTISKSKLCERSIELQAVLSSSISADGSIAKIKNDFERRLTDIDEKEGLLPKELQIQNLKVTQFGNLIFDSIIREFLTPLNRKSIKYEKPTIVDVSKNKKLNNLLKKMYNSNIASDSIEYNFFKFWLNEFGYGQEYRLTENNHNIEITFDKNKKLDSFGRGLQSLIKTLITITCTAHSNYVGPNIGYSSSLVILIEPESNLHPDLQSKLADLLVDSNNKFKIQFIVETHSEYLIRKLQYWTSMGTIKPGATTLNYFDHDKGWKTIIINEITIDEDGNLSDDFGPDFIDHAPKLMLDLLNLKKKNNLN